MRKYIYILNILLLSILFISCSKDSDEPNVEPTPVPTVAKIEFPATEDTKPVFGTEGGTATIKFTATQAWTAIAANDRASEWLSISPSSGTAGSSALTITTKENDTYDERSASITIKSGTAQQTIVITQKQKDALLVTSDKFEVDAEGCQISVEVKANIDFSIQTDVDWISQVNTRALNTSNLTFNISENEEITKREGHITISSGDFSETVSVYQAGSIPTIIISKNEYTISSEGGDITVEVQSNVDISVTLPDDGWISESTTRSMSTHTYVFTVSKNEDYDSRSGEILFTNKENNLSEKVIITQMQRDAIIVARSRYEYDAEGGTLSFEVQTNVDFEVSVDADWITMADTRALHTEKLSFNVAANDTYDERTTTITIKGLDIKQTVNIVQHGLVAVSAIEISQSTLELFVGNSERLTALVLPSNASNKEVTWSCNDTSIATIDEEGNVTAVTPGEAIVTITTTNGKITASCKVIVKEDEIIIFADDNVKKICVRHFDSNHDGELSMNEAAAVTSIPAIRAEVNNGKIIAEDQSVFLPIFSKNTYASRLFDGMLYDIYYFNELQYFKSLNSCGQYMFRFQRYLSEVTLPQNIQVIGMGAFEGCSSLTSINIPSSVSQIKNEAFKDCRSLTSIDIPSNITVIAPYTFKNCSSLTNINIPSSVTTIYLGAFEGCSSLTSINIPSSVKVISENAFKGCSSLTNINIADGVTEIYAGAFKGCSSLNSINIPSSVTTIGEGAFEGCSSLTSINIPSSVTTIGEGAFVGCSSLTNINIPSSITSIGEGAFEGSSLTNVSIADGVTEIYAGAFKGCSSLNSINIPSSVTNIGDAAFAGCSSLTSINIPSSVTTIGYRAFSGCSSLTSINIPSSVTTIGEGAFSGCSSLASINIPSSVTSIGGGAFYGCSSLTHVSIADGVTKIAYTTFYGCSSLTNINIPSSVTTIGNSAFWGCI